MENLSATTAVRGAIGVRWPAIVRGRSMASRLVALAAVALLSLPAAANAGKKRKAMPKSNGQQEAPAKRWRKAPGTSDEAPAAAVRSEREQKQDGSEGAAAAGDDVAGDGEAERATDEDGPRARRRAHPSEGADADVAATAEPAPSGPGSRWLELAVGARAFSRTLAYNQLASPGVRHYQLALGPAAVLDLAFYPLALALDGPAAGIGLVAAIEQAVGTSSQLAADGTFPNGATFPTSMREFAGGIRYRIPLDAWQLGAAVTGGEHAFWFTSGAGADRAALDIPNAIYRFVRGGVDVRVAVTADFSLAAGAGYRHVLNQGGAIRNGFPHLTVAGVDANVGASYAITRNIEARVQADVRRYFYDMHSVAGDARLAGGAVDQYLSIAALLAMTLDRDP